MQAFPLLGLVVIATLIQVSSSALYGCATTNVNIRTGPSTRYRRLGLLYKGKCLQYKGLVSWRRSWARVIYKGRYAVIYKRYLIVVNKPPTPAPPPPPPCPHIITRAQWGARAAKWRSRMRSVPSNIYIHHSTGSGCTTYNSCKAKVKGFQNYHMNNRGWSDIGYSFLIGEDGNIYEGRGWMMTGGHTRGFNSVGFGICFIGDFTRRSPNSRALAAYNRLIQCAVSRGQLRSNYLVRGHRDKGATACPGTTFYNQIRSWSHYRSRAG